MRVPRAIDQHMRPEYLLPRDLLLRVKRHISRELALVGLVRKQVRKGVSLRVCSEKRHNLLPLVEHIVTVAPHYRGKVGRCLVPPRALAACDVPHRIRHMRIQQRPRIRETLPQLPAKVRTQRVLRALPRIRSRPVAHQPEQAAAAPAASGAPRPRIRGRAKSGKISLRIEIKARF